jgi:hypothetical protein
LTDHILKQAALDLTRGLPASDRLDLADAMVISVAALSGMSEEQFAGYLPSICRVAEKIQDLLQQEEAATVGHVLLLVSRLLHTLRGEVTEVERKYGVIP